MIIVLFLIGIAVVILGCYISSKNNSKSSWDYETSGIVATVLGATVAAISFIVMIVLLVSVINLKVIDQKIDMYQEQNAQIEIQVAECVKQYQQYENEIFTEVKPESYIMLVSLYPELKSDTLVAKQIELYIANNESIKELKELKIDGDIYRWWLYFGKNKT